MLICVSAPFSLVERSPRLILNSRRKHTHPRDSNPLRHLPSPRRTCPGLGSPPPRPRCVPFGRATVAHFPSAIVHIMVSAEGVVRCGGEVILLRMAMKLCKTVCTGIGQGAKIMCCLKFGSNFNRALKSYF